MVLQVIGAGLGRTGTKSLKVALEDLGYGKCYHMMEARPWQVPMWADAANGKEIDWEKLFEGYAVGVDWPIASYYKELAERYPEAKVILTVRDPEQWYRSVMETIYQISSHIPWFMQLQADYHSMIWKGIWDRHFHGKITDKEYAISMYKAHIEEVKRTIPSSRLLVFEAKEGWGPLCKFLGKPVPDHPFPHINEAADLKRQAKLLKVLYYVSLAVPAAVAGLLLWRYKK
eukprot:TRINITY_DN759_c1_g2_i1.p1 TRINITY_DN759_c1_g2~~TRINITY_DN759_c1_g2_i1.p1  ORF type:complete len:230 (+),score=61.29 TRINITY_DN759_c1_g2_i1:65-754(+)